MNIEILPKILSGSIVPPPSKSIAHRAVICASFSDGISKISNIDFSDDIMATIGAMKVLGAKIDELDGELIVEGIYRKNNYRISNDNNKLNINKVIDCNESGSTLRFIIPMLTLFDDKFEIKTAGNLINRPLDIYFEIFDKVGIEYTKLDKTIKIVGGKKINLDRISIRGDISSQFISGLLMYLPLLEIDTKIEIVGQLESKNYVDLTINVMKDFGVSVENIDYKTFKIKGNQKYISNDLEVESDYSQAAFFLVANEIGNTLDISGLSKESKQGDKKVLEIVDYFKKKNNLNRENHQYCIDGRDIPDIVPILSLLFSMVDAKTIITNLDRLKIKESDRLENTRAELSKLGIDIEIEKIYGKSALIISGIKDRNLKGGVVVDSHKDHRIAMMLAIAGTICEEKIKILDADCVSKSYPKFWDEYIRLGGEINVCDLGKEY